ncbi:hypothetical protein HanRHA438_Chr08g0339871 [Helianthus annuus]|nr:hypothetical protein HanRHA438_Chr08g0339871 [Helianthus annuus]
MAGNAAFESASTSSSEQLRRVLGVSVGSTAEENSYKKSISPMADLKDLKRFRLSVEDACVKARVRANRIDERLRKLDKYYEDITSKKQKRNDLTSIDRSGALNLKMGTQIYSMNQRVEDRPKNILLNKRVRTSVAESRAKDGNLHDDNAGESVFEKIRRLAAGGEGWDKKGKRKRSTGPVSTRPIDDDGVPKRAVQNKVVVENGSQPRDAHIYRLNTRDDSVNSRKRPISLGSSSPPMAAQWVGQRPQKMARARRPFLVSLVSNQDEKRISFESCSPLDSSPISKLATNGPKKLNVKLESHESVGGQTRLTDKEVVCSVTNATEYKHNPLISSAAPRPYQSRKTGCKKNGSKPGRRLKKLSDRKGFSHHSPLPNVSSPDCPGASDDDREELLAAANHARTATYLACSSPFWKKMEPVFAHVDSDDKSFISQQVDSVSDPLSENGSFSRKHDVDRPSNESIPLFQRVLSALMIEEDVNTHEGDAGNMQFPNPICVSTYDTHNLNDSTYENAGVVDKLLLELKSIGLCPEMLVGPLSWKTTKNDMIQDEIDKLNTRLHQQEVKKKAYLEKINNNIDSNSRARDLETRAMDRLSTRRSSRSGVQKVPKQAALAFGKRTLARCHKFEISGTSCFNEPPFHDILSAKLSPDEAIAINGPLSNRGKRKKYRSMTSAPPGNKKQNQTKDGSKSKSKSKSNTDTQEQIRQ